MDLKKKLVKTSKHVLFYEFMNDIEGQTLNIKQPKIGLGLTLIDDFKNHNPITTWYWVPGYPITFPT